MSTFFTSDTHFGHENIIRYCKRPFRNAEEMDHEMVVRWNSVVGPQDTVYHLGDVAFTGSAQHARWRISQLNGHIHLIRGNHEALAERCQDLFASIQNYAEIEVEKQSIVLFHYGMRTWHHASKGVWHLYGHSHNMLPPYGKSVDVGVDRWNFTPVAMDQLREFMAKQSIGDKEPKFENFTPSNATQEAHEPIRV